METPTPKTENPPCDECRCADAVQFGDRWFCVDCYANSGASCAGGDEDSAC